MKPLDVPSFDQIPKNHSKWQRPRLITKKQSRFGTLSGVILKHQITYNMPLN